MSRTVTIAQGQDCTVTFIPRRTSANTSLLPEDAYAVTCPDGIGAIALPTFPESPSRLTIRYSYTIDQDTGTLTGFFYLAGGDSVSLNELRAFGGNTDEPLQAYIDERVGEGGGLQPVNNLSDVDSALESRTNLGLGTASILDVGTDALEIVQLDADGKLPAVDGSNLTNLAGDSMGYAIHTDAAYGNAVVGGPFYASDATLYDNDFFLIVRARPTADNAARYMFCTSRSGNHVLMFGFNSVGSGYLKPVAYHNANNMSVQSDVILKAGEWHEFALGLVGCSSPTTGTFFTYIDGVCVGRQAKASSRTGNSTPQQLFIGGNEHSTFDGNINGVVLYEGANQFPWAGGEMCYRPSQGFDGTSFGYYGQMKASFLMSFERPCSTVPDLSNGFNGSVHPGKLITGYNDGNFGAEYAQDLDTMPTWVYDPYTLSEHDGTAIPALDANAIVQDNFTRANKTLQDGRTMGLGMPEYGPSAWENDTDWGIIENYAFANTSSAVKINPIDTGQTTYSIEVTPLQSYTFTYGPYVHIIFRYQDASNYYKMLLSGLDGSARLTKITAGVEGAETTVGGALSAGWTRAKLTLTAGGNLTLRLNGGSTAVATWTGVTGYSTATKVGMATNSVLRKFKKFAVYAT